MKKILTVLVLTGFLLSACSSTKDLQGSFSGAKSTSSVKTTTKTTTSVSSSKYVAKIEAVTPKTTVTNRAIDRVTIGKWKVTAYKDGKLTQLELSWPDSSDNEMAYGDDGDYFDEVQLEVESGGTTTAYDVFGGASAKYPVLSSGQTYNLAVTGLINRDKSVYGGLSISTFTMTLDTTFGGKNSYTWNKSDGYAVNSYFNATPDTDDGMLFGGITFSVK